MTRKEIFDFQVSKLPKIDGIVIKDLDKEHALGKAVNIVDGYVNYRSGSELDYVVVDIAVDILKNDLMLGKQFEDSMNIPGGVSSIREGDTTVSFNTNTSNGNQVVDMSGKKTTPTGSYYLDTYKDELNRFRVMK